MWNNYEFAFAARALLGLLKIFEIGGNTRTSVAIYAGIMDILDKNYTYSLVQKLLDIFERVLDIFNKRKNLEFQMLAAVYHKGDHGQHCYTLK